MTISSARLRMEFMHRTHSIWSRFFRSSVTPSAAEQIRLGLVSLNYLPCERTDAPVKEGDVISLRGRGKGCLAEVGGRSKKDRLFVTAQVYL